MIHNFIRHLDRLLLRISLNPVDHFAISMQMSKRERIHVANSIIGKNFLEIGSGYSTLWFSQFAYHIVSVETRKEWLENIQGLLNDCDINNVMLSYMPPEASAYDEQGVEKWNNRKTGKSDYGTAEEFSGYLQGIEKLVSNNEFHVILVDGNVREEIVRMLQHKKYMGKILLHDVEPQRDYLNDKILTMDGINIVNKVDTLVELTVGEVDAANLPR
jgi:hypothetical protein